MLIMTSDDEDSVWQYVFAECYSQAQICVKLAMFCGCTLGLFSSFLGCKHSTAHSVLDVIRLGQYSVKEEMVVGPTFSSTPLCVRDWRGHKLLILSNISGCGECRKRKPLFS